MYLFFVFIRFFYLFRFDIISRCGANRYSLPKTIVASLMKFISFVGVLSLVAAISNPIPAHASILVGNTEGNNVIKVSETTGNLIGEFISPFSGFESPDALVYGPDSNLYVSSGNKRENAAIYRFDGQTGALIDKFASGEGLFRPYGLAFGPDGLLYVSSFRSDKILRYDGTTGEFVDVFAQRDGTAAGLNGPNGLLFGPDQSLYVTTQGSVANEEGALDFAFPSQILRYDIETGSSEVFVEQPEPFAKGTGFVSFLGLATSPEDEDLYVSDFAGGIRRYDFDTGTELATFDTNYTETNPSSNFVGSLAFGPDSDLYSVGFNAETLVGSLFKFDTVTGDRTLLATDAPFLQRPIGVVFKPEIEESQSVPEPGAIASLVMVGLCSIAAKRLDRKE